MKSVKSIGKLSRIKIRLMFQFLKNIHFETPNEGKPIFTATRIARTRQMTVVPVSIQQHSQALRSRLWMNLWNNSSHNTCRIRLVYLGLLVQYIYTSFFFLYHGIRLIYFGLLVQYSNSTLLTNNHSYFQRMQMNYKINAKLIQF